VVFAGVHFFLVFTLGVTFGGRVEAQFEGFTLRMDEFFFYYDGDFPPSFPPSMRTGSTSEVLNFLFDLTGRL